MRIVDSSIGSIKIKYEHAMVKKMNLGGKKCRRRGNCGGHFFNGYRWIP